MSKVAVLPEEKKACSESMLEDGFLCFIRRAGLSSDTTVAKDIWEEIESVKDMRV